MDRNKESLAKPKVKKFMNRNVTEFRHLIK